MAIPVNANSKYAMQKSNNVHCTSSGNTIIPINGILRSNNEYPSTFSKFIIKTFHKFFSNA